MNDTKLTAEYLLTPAPVEEPHTALKPMRDSDEMPFGKHAGEKLGDVPASYLIWLWYQPWCKDEHPQLWKYIDSGIKVLEEEKRRSYR